MFKKFLSLMGFCVLVVSANTVTKVLHFSEPVVRDNVVSCEDGFPIAEVYAPEVCVKIVKLLLPVGRQAKSVSVQYEDLVKSEGNYYLKPHLPVYNKRGNYRKKSDINAADISMINQFYQRDELYPGIKRNEYTPQTAFKCGIPIGITAVTPFQYNPVKEELYYYKKVTVIMETEPVDASRDVAAYNCTPFIKSILQRIVDNKNAVLDLPFTEKDADDYDYLIVSREDMANGDWDDFVDFNKRRGMKTEVHSIKDILADPQNTGVDFPEKLRTFIKRQFNENKITFVLLGGDNEGTGENSIPCRELYSIFYDHYHQSDRKNELYSATDLYYEGLDGDWKGSEDKWGLPGNEDMLAEVYVARFPIDGLSDYQNLSNKTFMYSENPVKDEVKRALYLGDQLWEDADDPGQYIWGIDVVLQSYGYCNNFGFETQGIPDDGSWAVVELSDKQNGSSFSWINSGLKQEIDSHYPAWINHTGAGNNTFACQTNQSNINDTWITNDGNNHNFFFLMSCSNKAGNFDEAGDCWGETFVTISNGAVATYLSNNHSFGDDDDINAPEARLNRYFHDALFNQGKRIPFLEGMHVDSREANVGIILANDTTATDPTGYFGIIRYCAYNTNVFGDPALSIWTATPDSLHPSYDSVITGTTFTAGTPPFTWVALLTENDSIICTHVTGIDADSNCVINDQVLADYVNANPLGKLKVRIKAHNYFPYVGNLDINILGYTPELFDTNGTAAALPVFLRNDGSDTVDISYQLRDQDSPNNAITAQYRVGLSPVWKPLTNMKGDTGVVSAADSSVHRHIRWHAKGQLTDTLESDSVQVRIIASDPKTLSDTLSMANPDLVLDFKAPDTVKAVTATAVSPAEIALTWAVSLSQDADSQLVIYSTAAITTIADTVGNSWKMLADTVDSFFITNLSSDTKYYFSIFVKDEVPNWNTGSFTTVTTPNVPPTCSIDPIVQEQSDTVSISFTLTDTELDTLHISCSYSTNGSSWTAATLPNIPVSIPSDFYNGKQLSDKWPSKISGLPVADEDSLYFMIIPTDNASGTSDTIIFHLDNYQKQSIVLTTPTGEQNGDVVIPYVVSDVTNDSITLLCNYSLDGGSIWESTQNVDITKIGPDGYIGSVTWNSTADIDTQNITTVKFSTTPSDGWGMGTPDTTENFHVNNDSIPLIVKCIKQPVVVNDTVTMAVRITAPDYPAITIEKAEFSINDGTHYNATLATGTAIQAADYDSAVIIWVSKKDFTGNASNVKLHFTFKADTNTQKINTNHFSLSNNEIPSVAVPVITGEQNGDVEVPFAITDPDYDTIRISVYYSEDAVNWQPASVSGDTGSIDSSQYANASITWKSSVDFPDAVSKTVWLKITPFDQDTGIADSTQIIVTNEGIPVCDPLTLPVGDTLSGDITVTYKLNDENSDTLAAGLYFASDTGWVKTTSTTGKTDSIIPSEYSGSLIWHSKTDLPNTFIQDMQVKLVPSDKSFTGQSGESKEFILNNLDSTVAITGDFNKDGGVDFLDFSYVSEYWYKSANGITHPDSIQELAPSTGEPPYLTVVGDSLFNYEDLGVFIQMYYWSIDNNGYDNSIAEIQEDQDLSEDPSAVFLVSNQEKNVTVHCNVNNVTDLVSCKYIISFNNEILEYDAYLEKGKLTEQNGDIFAKVQQTNSRVQLGFTRLSAQSFSVSGSGTISDIILKRMTDIASNVIVHYTLINAEHKEIESRVVKLTIPAYNKLENTLTILPNPSRPCADNKLLTLTHNPNAVQWVEREKCGFVFRIELPELDSEEIINAAITIYDATGNKIAGTPITALALNKLKSLDVYWNGCNKNGRKIGNAIYKLILNYETKNGKQRMIGNIGIKN